MPPERTREARFTELYEAHYDAVCAYAWRRDPEHCDDVVAETFLVAWRRLDDVPRDSLGGLIVVERNARLNLTRAARRRVALRRRLQAGERRIEAAPASPKGAAVGVALARLSETDREILLLAVWDDLDRQAIARVLGCSQANVSVRLHRARKRLAALLDRSALDHHSSQEVLSDAS
jgi:RNA polymerase sigma-70 factor (ECF subfamily)